MGKECSQHEKMGVKRGGLRMGEVTESLVWEKAEGGSRGESVAGKC